MIEENILKQLGIILLSSVKFMVANPTSYLIGYSYLHTILNTTFGGWIGVLFFYFLGRAFFNAYPRWKRVIKRFVYSIFKIPVHRQLTAELRRSQHKIFTRRNRYIIKIRRKYGFAGLIILTPVLLSIPIGTLLVLKYYSGHRGLLGWLSLSVIAWSVVISTVIEVL